MTYDKNYWTTPNGYIFEYSRIILNGYHILIAGASGSGKSVLINRLVYDILLNAPTQKQLILVDPKRIELSIYKTLPHCIYYGNNAQTIADAVNSCYNIMLKRFAEMEKHQIKLYNGSTIYLIIDEFTDIKYNYPELIEKIILISSMGRAAKTIVILATQRPTKDILNGAIQCNFSTRIGLRTDSKQDSKNIIQNYGCENLPLFGYAYLKSSEFLEPQLFKIDPVTDQEIKTRVDFWNNQK